MRRTINKLGWLFALAALVADASAQRSPNASEQAYELLETEPLYVHPSGKGRVDDAKVRQVAQEVLPMSLKVLVVPKLADKWRRGGRELRGSYARWVLNDRLALENAVVIVYTLNGITSYSDRVDEERLVELSNQAAKKASRQDFTPAIVWLARATSEEARLARSPAGARPAQGASKDAVGETDAISSSPGVSEALEQASSRQGASEAQSQSSQRIALGLVLGVPAAVLAVVAIQQAARRRRELAAAKAPLEDQRHQVLEGISYLDGFADLLGNPEDATGLKNARERAYQRYEQAARVLREAKTPLEASAAAEPLRQALADIEQGKRHIDAATGGSKVAFVVPPPQLPPAAPLYEPVENVCYLCSRPGNDDLTAVTINLDGKKRTVLVCPDDLAAMERGEEPRLRGRYLEGRFVPWYMVQGYDPRVSFGVGGFVWDALAMSAIMNMVNPFSSARVVNNYYGSDGVFPAGFEPNWGSSVEPPESAPFGLDMAGDFGGGDFGSDFGGDFGAGDFGGGDFGGGDSGGGDFGGGDFGGDFGGGDS